MEEKTYLISTHMDDEGNLYALPVGDALFCGKCKPAPQPVIVSDKNFKRKLETN